MHPILIGSRTGLSHATLSNIEQAYRQFWQDTLLHEARLFEDDYQYYLSGDGAFVAFDFSEIPAFSQDTLTMIDGFTKLVGHGITAQNAAEIVGLVLPEQDGLDMAYMTMSLVPVGMEAPEAETTEAPVTAEEDMRDGKAWKYSDDQPRDEAGRWSSDGGGGDDGNSRESGIYSDYSYLARSALELKLKRGLVNRKVSHRLPAIPVNGHVSRTDLEAGLDQADLPGLLRSALRHLHPSLVNSYWRHYFLSADRRFRLTVDSNLQFAAAHQSAGDGVGHSHSARTVVVELKFSLDAADGADYITNALPLRLARCSKYVLGISTLVD